MRLNQNQNESINSIFFIRFQHTSSFTIPVFKMGLTILVAQAVFIFRAKLWKVVVKCEIVMFFNFWVFYVA